MRSASEPDWWKLESQASAAGVEQYRQGDRGGNDPYCRGIVLLGLEASEEQLAASFAIARGCALVKGFAVGRTIFAEPARAWLAGEIDDAGAVDLMARSFARLCKMWQDSPAEADKGQ